MKRPEILFFDVNETLLDLTPLQESVAHALGDRSDLVTLWFTTLLHHSLVETCAGSFHEFGEIGAAVMVMVAKNNGVELDLDAAREATKPITSLPPHADVIPALQLLKKAGYRMAPLTNSPQHGLEAQVEFAGLGSFFEKQLSVSNVKIYKPHPGTYHWAAAQFGVSPENCMLIAAHGWDTAGAQWAGLRSAFVARPGAQIYPLGPTPDITGKDLLEIAEELAQLK
ncbi:haloacid dehalogenase type II [Luteolibacter sp. AS25]|uniref:haloacid dehalogenase type II n=1 Tax=Luteolibacter sp. AS25 TaxID=3135776 RepID=UPI00398B8135